MKPAGTEVYYAGDICNQPKFGFVMAPREDRFGKFYDIMFLDGSTLLGLPAHSLGDVYSGNGSTRFVTRAAYNKWRRDRAAESEAAIRNAHAQLHKHNKRPGEF